MSQYLYLIEEENKIIPSQLFEELCDINESVKKHISLRAIKPSEQFFLDSFLDIVDDSTGHSFSIDLLTI